MRLMYEIETYIFLKSCYVWSDVILDILTIVVRKIRSASYCDEKYKNLVVGMIFT